MKKTVKFEISNRALYTLLSVIILVLAGTAVYAYANPATGVGHDLVDIGFPSCSAGEVLEWDGSAWVCGTDDAGAGGSSLWAEADVTKKVSYNNLDFEWVLDTFYSAVDGWGNMSTDFPDCAPMYAGNAYKYIVQEDASEYYWWRSLCDWPGPNWGDLVSTGANAYLTTPTLSYTGNVDLTGDLFVTTPFCPSGSTVIGNNLHKPLGCFFSPSLNTYGATDFRSAQMICYNDFGGARLATVQEVVLAMLVGVSGYSGDTWTGDVSVVGSHWTVYGNSIGYESGGQLTSATLESHVDTSSKYFHCWLPAK